MKKGFILMEVSISYVILSLALAALVPAMIVALKANKKTEKIKVAAELSLELLEEVRMRRWDEATGLTPAYVTAASTLGIDTGETSGDKTTFDDIDDFNGYTESGVKDPVGRAMSEYSTYKRAVTVSYVDSSFAVSVSTTDYKMITVCTTPLKETAICLKTMMTNR